LAGTDALPLVEIGDVTDAIRRTVYGWNIDLVITGRPACRNRRAGWPRRSSDAPAPWSLPCEALAV
jgi:hypothetical protein